MSEKIGLEMVVDRNLKEIFADLEKISSLKKKVEFIERFPPVVHFFEQKSQLKQLLRSFSDEDKFVLYSALALGQGERIFDGAEKHDLENLAKALRAAEEFYREIGGLIGYHLICLDLLAKKEGKKGRYFPPTPIDISEDNVFTRQSMISALQHLNELAEIYPLGGAADRLNHEEAVGFQIAATLEFCEKTLLERLIDDLKAREFLFYKLFGKQVTVPIVLMTSDEKGGTSQVQKIFSEKKWFGRNRDDFFFFSQPLVPTMDKEGQWIVIGKAKLLFKPGGHGVIWKLAQESGAFDWLKNRGKTKALMRQINNLVASIDYGLLSFLGLGFDLHKDFGFAACPCTKGVSEGVNVVIDTGNGCCLTNVEYCDGIENLPSSLANTNLLFVSIKTIEELLESCPIPGMLVNAKKLKYRDGSGVMQEKEVVRLESTMQNIADALIEPGTYPLELKRSYITANQRKKTISTIKKEFAFGSSMLQTPEQCYIDLLENGRDLLVNYCDFQVPHLNDSTSFFQNGPSFIFQYHPALGPLYQIIRQKLKKGRLASGSELKLEIADLYVENLDVDGSLEICTDSIMGSRDVEGVIRYSDQTGKCTLKNVRIRNSGINREATRSFWKDEVVHREKCKIFIEEGGEFYAENVLLRGEMRIWVPSGKKVTAFMKGGRVEFKEEELSHPSWTWRYRMGPEYQIVLEK